MFCAAVHKVADSSEVNRGVHRFHRIFQNSRIPCQDSGLKWADNSISRRIKQCIRLEVPLKMYHGAIFVAYRKKSKSVRLVALQPQRDLRIERVVQERSNAAFASNQLFDALKEDQRQPSRTFGQSGRPGSLQKRIGAKSIG